SSLSLCSANPSRLRPCPTAASKQAEDGLRRQLGKGLPLPLAPSRVRNKGSWRERLCQERLTTERVTPLLLFSLDSASASAGLDYTESESRSGERRERHVVHGYRD